MAKRVTRRLRLRPRITRLTPKELEQQSLADSLNLTAVVIQTGIGHMMAERADYDFEFGKRYGSKRLRQFSSMLSVAAGMTEAAERVSMGEDMDPAVIEMCKQNARLFMDSATESNPRKTKKKQ